MLREISLKFSLIGIFFISKRYSCSISIRSSNVSLIFFGRKCMSNNFSISCTRFQNDSYFLKKLITLFTSLFEVAGFKKLFIKYRAALYECIIFSIVSALFGFVLYVKLTLPSFNFNTIRIWTMASVLFFTTISSFFTNFSKSKVYLPKSVLTSYGAGSVLGAINN